MKKETDKERLNLTAEPELVRKMDEWRRKQPDLPSRSEAIRRAMEMVFGKDVE